MGVWTACGESAAKGDDMLTYKTGLVPHCDIHGDQEMDLRDLKTHDIIEALAFKCSVTGCRKYFHRQLGYQSENYLPRHPQVQCARHQEHHPFTIVVSDGAGSLRYVCTIEGCDETLPYPLRVQSEPAAKERSGA